MTVNQNQLDATEEVLFKRLTAQLDDLKRFHVTVKQIYGDQLPDDRTSKDQRMLATVGQLVAIQTYKLAQIQSDLIQIRDLVLATTKDPS